MTRTPALVVAAAFLAACSAPTPPADDLDRAALEASRDGSLANFRQSGRGRAGIEAAGRVAARYYWVAKYSATSLQREVAVSRARASVEALARRHKKPASRYLAVATKRDARAKTSTNVMIFDTQSESIIGNTVYDLNDRPPGGEAIRFETYSASFVPE